MGGREGRLVVDVGVGGRGGGGGQFHGRILISNYLVLGFQRPVNLIGASQDRLWEGGWGEGKLM